MGINSDLLKQEMKTNIISENDTKTIIGNVLKVLSSAISKSLGPYGSTTIIKDPYNIDHIITKDGYSILKEISFNGGLQSTILSIIKKISKSLVETVGDGSTSSVVVAEEMYNSLNNFFNSTVVPRKDVLDFLDYLQEEIIQYVKENSKELKTKEELIKIASISNNNDKRIGELVADIYEELDFKGFINLELSPTDKTYHKITNGVEILRGYINFIYANQKDKISCIYEEPRILLCNDELNESDMMFLAELLTLSMASEFPLVIIAKGYSSDITNFLNNNKVKAKDRLPIVPIEYNLSTLARHEEFQDLAIYLNATIYDKYNGEQLDKQDAGKFFTERLGQCSKVIVNEKRTLLIEGKFDSKNIEDRLKEIDDIEETLNEKANFQDVSSERYELNKRRGQLKGKIATLYVGGSSDLEKRTRRDLVEDSIYACKSAIENGYVIGGNLIIPSILLSNKIEISSKLMSNKEIFKGTNPINKELLIESLIDIVIESFSSSFIKVLYNKFLNIEECQIILNECLCKNNIYNLKTNLYESIDTTDVINSSMTDIEIMKSVFSIIGLLASSNQMLALDNIYEYEF